jgi:hypothetical protein
VRRNGEVIRTGMGAMAGNQAWHAHRRGFGPALDGLFMQSNFGIVTKMGKWLTPRPEVYAPVEVRAANESDLEALIDTMRPLLLDGTVTNVPLLGTLTGAASMIKPRAQWHPQRRPRPGRHPVTRQAGHLAKCDAQILGLNPRITDSSAASRRSSHDDRTHGRFRPGY